MQKYDDRVIVVDSYMGKGKTSWAIQYINELPDDIRIIYITPFLTEVTRIINACSDKQFKQPSRERGGGSKMVDLIKLVCKGENIASTHALFGSTNDELLSALRTNNYVLFLDEVFQTVEKYNIQETEENSDYEDAITKKDIETLLSNNLIKVEDDFSISWVDENKYLSQYSSLISMANRGLLYFVYGSLVMWSFPIEVFREGIFSQIFILTHRFESQLQAYYYKYFDLPYTKYAVYNRNNQYVIEKIDFDEDELIWKEQIKKKIHILEDIKMNRLGDVYYDARNHPYKSSLSKTWYEKNVNLFPIITKNLVNYFVNITKSKASERLWTAFKEDIPKIKNKYISKNQWLACGAKATNDYGDRTVLAYILNRYVDIFYDDFFQRKDIQINQDEYALSEMLQWIWRSAIRNGKDIQIYMPSARMRTLLYQYLNNEKIEF